MKYYKIVDNLGVKKRWFLGNIEGVAFDFWKYTQVNPLTNIPSNLPFTIRENGISMDFTFADFELPIVNQKIKNLINPNEAAFFLVSNTDFKSDYYLMQILNEVDCVDESRSTFDKYELNDEIRPDKAGYYKTIYNFVIKENLNCSLDIFRVKHYDVVIIVSENFKKRFEESNLIGIKFVEV